MKKGVVWALVLMGFCALTYIFSRGKVDISIANLVIKNVPTGLAFLSYTGIGLVIGVLIK